MGFSEGEGKSLNPRLFLALTEELSIFKKFRSFKQLGDWTACSSPDVKSVPHWNLGYSMGERITMTRESLRELKNHYEQMIVSGHLPVEIAVDSLGLTLDPEKYAEVSEYFVLSPSLRKSLPELEETVSTRIDLEEFSTVMAKCFKWNGKTREYFLRKITMLRDEPGSHFYSVSIDGGVVGCCSIFQTENGSDFMFNVATLPEFSGKGLASSVIREAASAGKVPLYIYSHNEAMRTNVLPKLGFKSIGFIGLVSVK